jgi:hypothetical protein
MALEDEINARLRHLSEEIRAFRENIEQLRQREARPFPRRPEKPRAEKPPPLRDPNASGHE